jgi:acetyl-CoA carboxylase biotin carboxyl carrier protein
MSDSKSIIDQGLIRELANLLTETGLTEIEVEHDTTRIRVARTPAPVAQVASVTAAVTPAPKSEPAAPASAKSQTGAVLSPMVGTAFRAPEPGGKPYVEIGDRVREGQTLLIVEAMKTMNQIPAPRAGIVTSVLVEDGQPVEYGEPLLTID